MPAFPSCDILLLSICLLGLQRTHGWTWSHSNPKTRAAQYGIYPPDMEHQGAASFLAPRRIYGPQYTGNFARPRPGFAGFGSVGAPVPIILLPIYIILPPGSGASVLPSTGPAPAQATTTTTTPSTTTIPDVPLPDF